MDGPRPEGPWSLKRPHVHLAHLDPLEAAIYVIEGWLGWLWLRVITLINASRSADGSRSIVTFPYPREPPM